MRRRLGERVATLPANVIHRISADLGSGVGVAVGYAVVRTNLRQVHPSWWSGLVPGLVVGAVLGGMATGALIGLLRRIVQLVAAFRLPADREVHRRRRAGLVVLGVAVGLVVPLVVRIADTVVAAVLPALLVAVFGFWMWSLAHRRLRRSSRWWAWRASDVLAALATALVLVTLFSRDLLTSAPAAGLLFPVAAWFSARTWGVMTRSRRLTVRVAADLVLSLLLGVDFVLFVVWLANLLELPHVEVAVLRGVLDRVGALVDLPWWLWASLYLLLAGASLAFALWPAARWSTTRNAVAGWALRLRVVPSVNAGRRLLTCVHIGLLVTVLIGTSVPAALAAPLRDKLRARYQVAVQREFEAQAAQVAYEQIRRRFTAGTLPRPPLAPLIDLVGRVHGVSAPKPGQQDATGVERDLARRLGLLQAAALRIGTPTPRGTAPPTADATASAGFDAPISDTADARQRLSSIDDAERQSKDRARQAERIAELAATAVASTLSIPNLGENEVVQVVREYLGGLVESGVLTKVFLAWTKPLVAPATATNPDRVVVPNPVRLEEAALLAYVTERSEVRLADPFATDATDTRIGHESATEAAVDLANETRYFQEGGNGPCPGCPRPAKPNEDIFGVPHEGPGEIEPHIEPHIPVR